MIYLLAEPLAPLTKKKGGNMKKILINCSNHPSSRWDENQKFGWDKIVDIPLPYIPPEADMEQVKDVAKNIIREVEKICRDNKIERPCIMVQGEFSLCSFLYQECQDWIFFFPTTERLVEEIHKADGSVEKKSQFKFIRWRILMKKYPPLPDWIVST
jgi:hypothetical protein